MTSGGQGRKDEKMDERLREKVQPVVVETVKSLIESNFCTVDVYLVLSYTLDPQQELRLRQALPEGVGLEIWSEAMPFGISCKMNNPDQCLVHREGQKKRYGPRRAARIKEGGAQLARQHRYVVKDKLPYYDFFLAFEDDMLIKQSHVKQHLKWMRYIRQISKHAVSNPESFEQWKNPLTEDQLSRFRPGFLRVEILSKEGRKPVEDKLHLPYNTTPDIDPRYCCETFDKIDPNMSTSRAEFSVQPNELMIWETTLFGQRIRALEPLKFEYLNWIDMLAVSPFSKAPPGLWPGDITPQKPPYLAPQYTDGKNLAQSAGWMGSQAEIMEFHTSLCNGGFVPPFDSPTHPSDGWGGTVEFWSGGIQLWAEKCRIQRFIPLKEFDRHLLHHTSDNKQLKMPQERQVLAQDMLGQLQVVAEHAAKKAGL